MRTQGDDMSKKAMEDFMAPIPEEAKIHHEKMKFWSDIVAAAFRCFLLLVGAMYIFGLFIVMYFTADRSWSEFIFMCLLVPSGLSLLFLFYVLYHRALFTVMSYAIEPDGRGFGAFSMFWLTYAAIIVGYGVLSGLFFQISGGVNQMFINNTIRPMLEWLP